MSDTHDKHEAKDEKTGIATAANAQSEPAKADALSQLMGASAPAPAKKPDLDKQAVRAAEQALAEGARAIAEANAALKQGPAAPTEPPRMSKKRELALRVLIGVNVLVMVVLVLLPSPKAGTDAQPVVPHHETPPPAHDPVVQKPSANDPVLRAFAMAEARDFRSAIAVLDQYLAETPRLDAGRKANVLLALEHYATQIGDFAAAQSYQRRTEALRSAHSMPEDLVQLALEAEKAGDVESMRRNWARLLLQQRQIPSSLYRHVAEAYLKLGDSYRTEAEQGEAAAREKQLQKAREDLRRQATQGNEAQQPSTGGGHK